MRYTKKLIEKATSHSHSNRSFVMVKVIQNSFADRFPSKAFILSGFDDDEGNGNRKAKHQTHNAPVIGLVRVMKAII